MTKDRSLIDLLKILKLHVEQHATAGLCGTINTLYNNHDITINECCLLNNYIEANKPDNAIKRRHTLDWPKSAFYFAKWSKPPRIRYINSLIANLSLS